MNAKRIAYGLGKGFVAGAAGTVAMTLAQMLEMKLRSRQGSTAPADAFSKVTNLEPKDEQARKNLAMMVHFDYGISWGLFRAFLSVFGIRGFTAALMHWTALQFVSMVILPAMKLLPPVKKWGWSEVLVESVMHAIYAWTTDGVYQLLSPRRKRSAFLNSAELASHLPGRKNRFKNKLMVAGMGAAGWNVMKSLRKPTGRKIMGKAGKYALKKGYQAGAKAMKTKVVWKAGKNGFSHAAKPIAKPIANVVR